ncbi:MauE/DoxX family redox-associated membrane protein [Mucilaginibacter pedocola]|uniref:Methylamine utilisation protein MauE domain-containing protein n=1 Tax=Mucilaginibacter pedocola TaxID=1792845 RepID=A0A1S9PLU3_9SPHI|nr:MauE/DoxX family redox-associated membrane protein [Mucilaginibacter pedocola]OOQ61930.1 hypothetical protein BC343_02385 [Mucilaginibacter pedocola]
MRIDTIPASRNHEWLMTAISALLIVLYTYTAFSKLLAFDIFKQQMYNQTLPKWAAGIIIWTLPGVELVTAFLIFKNRSRLYGYIASSILMTLFTGYVALVLAGYFGWMPCSCGGVIQSMDWKTHLLFNIFFLLLSLTGIYIINRERRSLGRKD